MSLELACLEQAVLDVGFLIREGRQGSRRQKISILYNEMLEAQSRIDWHPIKRSELVYPQMPYHFTETLMVHPTD